MLSIAFWNGDLGGGLAVDREFGRKAPWGFSYGEVGLRSAPIDEA